MGPNKTLIELHWGETKGNTLCFPCEHRTIYPELKEFSHILAPYKVVLSHDFCKTNSRFENKALKYCQILHIVIKTQFDLDYFLKKGPKFSQCQYLDSILFETDLDDMEPRDLSTE